MELTKQQQKNLGIIIVKMRDKLTISRRELARRIGINSHEVIKALEHGEITPAEEDLRKIANNMLEVSLVELLDLLNSSPSNSQLSFYSAVIACENIQSLEDCLEINRLVTEKAQNILEDRY